MSLSIGERLPAADTEMLAAERLGPYVSGACPLLWVMDGPCPSLDELVEHLRPRLPHKMRQRVRPTPWRLTRPLWVDVPQWSIEDHVHLVEDSRYWSEDGWLDFIAEILAVRLDCSKPPWQMWLIPRRDGSRFALVSLLHHALADGHSGVQLLLLSASPPLADTTELTAASVAPSPRSPTYRFARMNVMRDAAELAARDAADSVGVARAATRRLLDALRAPRAAWLQAREACAALGELAADQRRRPAKIPELNAARGARQRVGHFDMPGEDVSCVTEWLNCFPNDVFLSLVGAGVGRLLDHMGVSTQGVEIQVWVPVNIGGPRARAMLGNHFSGARVAVPIGSMGATERLRRVRVASRSVGASRLVAAGRLVTRLENALPAPSLRWAAQIALSPHTMNLIASHMVIPPLLQPLPGRRLCEARAWTFLPARHTMSFAAQSLNGRLSVNYLLDPVSLPDHELLVNGMEEHARILVEAAKARQASSTGNGVRHSRSIRAAHLHAVVEKREMR